MNPINRFTLVITRPQPQADQWVQRLQAQGWRACAFPMLEIRHAPAAHSNLTVWSNLDAVKALMFVSANALEGWWALLPEPLRQRWLLRWNQPSSQAAPRVWVTGLATAQMALRLGIPASCIDQPTLGSTEDSESLWQMVQDQVHPGVNIWIMRGAEAHSSGHQGGGHGRSWLGDMLRERGATVQYWATYERAAPVWSDAQQQHWTQLLYAQSSPNGLVWVFTSGQLLHEAQQRIRQTLSTTLKQGMPGVAVVTHERMVSLAQAAGWQRVHCTGPGLTSLMSWLEHGMCTDLQPPLESSS